MADDHHLILDALSAMMGNEYNVRAVDSTSAFLEALDTFQPDLAILDINIPGGDAFSAARQALERRPNLPIVFLSMYNEPTYVRRAAKVGARAYFSKQTPASELMEALHAVLQGENLLPEQVTEGEPARPELTARQIEVLRLIAAGSSAKDIANKLNISVRTAEFHRAAIMQRLNLHSTAQMTRYALANNLA